LRRSKSYLVFWEMVLLLASVLVFRSVWMFLDGIQFMGSSAGLFISLIIGVILCIGAFVALHKTPNE
jgi:hypothetical protein